MPKMHLILLGFTNSVCQTFTKSEERIQKFIEKGDSWYIYQNELDKTVFQQDVADENFRDLPRKTKSVMAKYDGYQKGLASMVYNFFDINSASISGKSTYCGAINKNILNQQLSEELHKLIIMKFEDREIYSSFEDNIRSDSLMDMQMIKKKLIIWFIFDVLLIIYMARSCKRKKGFYDH